MKATIVTLLLLSLAGGLHAEPLSEAGQQKALQLFTALGCMACHDFNQSGSNLAKSLDRIGLKLTEAEILHKLQLPPEQLGKGEQFMPSYQTTPLEQLQLLSRFLANRK